MHFSANKEYLPATSKRWFSDEIEIAITDYCLGNLKLSYIPLSIGRKEVEESFILNGPRPVYNSPNRKGIQSNSN